jgi:hypothetical protein
LEEPEYGEPLGDLAQQILEDEGFLFNSRYIVRPGDEVADTVLKSVRADISDIVCVLADNGFSPHGNAPQLHDEATGYVEETLSPIQTRGELSTDNANGSSVGAIDTSLVIIFPRDRRILKDTLQEHVPHIPSLLDQLRRSRRQRKVEGL